MADTGTKEDLRGQIEQALDQIRPALQADGGDVQLVDVDDQGVVSVQLVGACGGCPMSQMTLVYGVERAVKQHVPSVTRVIAIGGADYDMSWANEE